MPLQQYFSRFIGGGNWITRRKPQCPIGGGLLYLLVCIVDSAYIVVNEREGYG
jgi:hypothetical protein